MDSPCRKFQPASAGFFIVSTQDLCAKPHHLNPSDYLATKKGVDTPTKDVYNTIHRKRNCSRREAGYSPNTNTLTKVKTMSKTKTMPKMTNEEVSVAINAMLQAGWKLVRTEEQDGTTKFVFQLGNVETTLNV